MDLLKMEMKVKSKKMQTRFHFLTQKTENKDILPKRMKSMESVCKARVKKCRAREVHTE